MLVLSRKTDESIMIGGNIEIVVLGVEGETVKLGIRAPKDIEIFRKELYMNIQASNREAASSLLAINDVVQLLKQNRSDK
ncbi:MULTISPECIES: carbon storage regulator CsrA [Paenibacillus]|jgi:carbon storage regulator (csrA)|uniref:carbon storage regulator CsrA n=1 Tax=Paenibacillus TaxID=44249 RepID=UPI0001667D98|nr:MULTISPECIES: carbon storage regulator CsrA [Paenibacillus]ACT04366.1 carbon storage regulator, CsrA [Paenibacillus sp. JDR-2]MCK9858074.1 carbon storage regulator CsrA [Paenibacillus sp. ATY16]TCM97269.1 carbon storage regulator CsrA [Paenibacillus sp. BK033]